MRMQNFLLIILILTIGCKSPKPFNDLENENFKGEVIFVRDGNFSTFYNEKGYIIKKNKNETISSIQNYTYVNNKVQLITTRSKKVGDKTVFYYNPNGTLISAETITLFEGDDPETGFHSKSFYKIDDQGNQILDSVNGDSYIRDYYTNSIRDSTIDNLGKTITIYSEGNPINEIIFQVDNNGIRTNVSTITYQYSYDAQGNWIQQKSFVNDKEVKNKTRIIVYKGGDISQYEKIFNDCEADINGSKNSNTTTNNVIVGGSINNNSTNTQQEPQVQKQRVNCRECHGQGIRQCIECNGRGSMKCKSCYGRGWNNNGLEKRTCYGCGGTGTATCSRCSGKGNLGSCGYCRGKGQILE